MTRTAAGEAADRLVELIRARPWGLATVVIVGDDTEIATDRGDDDLDPTSLFQIGSITKTFTGVLLGTAVVAGELSLDASLGHVLVDAGRAAHVTVRDLAVQRSGLPRLPPNLDPSAVDAADPYSAYTEEDLVAALKLIDEPVAGTYGYSNFGFMLLGALLHRATGETYRALLEHRIFTPLRMTGAGCPPATEGRLPGYAGAEQVPWWTTQLPGAGGIGMSITDLGRYLRAHVDPPAGPLGQAIELATTLHAEPPSGMGLGWGHQGGGWWHNGRTGGFTSFAAFHRPTRTAVALLANSTNAELDSVGFETITQLVRAG